MTIRLLLNSELSYPSKTLGHWAHIRKWISPGTTPKEALVFLQQIFEEVAFTNHLSFLLSVEILQIITQQMQIILEDAKKELKTDLKDVGSKSNWETWLQHMEKGLTNQQTLLEKLSKKIHSFLKHPDCDECQEEKPYIAKQFLDFTNAAYLSKEELKSKQRQPLTYIVNKVAFAEWTKINSTLFDKCHQSKKIAFEFLEKEFKRIADATEYDLLRSKRPKSGEITQATETKLQLLRILIFKMKQFHDAIDAKRIDAILKFENILGQLLTRVSNKLKSPKQGESSENLDGDIAKIYRQIISLTFDIQLKTQVRILPREDEKKVSRNLLERLSKFRPTEKQIQKMLGKEIKHTSSKKIG